MPETVQAARSGICVEDIAFQIFDEDRIRRTLENRPEEALALLQFIGRQLSYHGPAMITVCQPTVNGRGSEVVV